MGSGSVRPSFAGIRGAGAAQCVGVQSFCDAVGTEAAARGLTEDELAQLLADD